MSFTRVCTFAVADSFTERCRKVYFAPDDYSLMAWGVVNAGLYFLFQEKAIVTEGAQKAQMLEYQALCRDNLETALTNLPLLMPARRDSIEVLVLGVCTRPRPFRWWGQESERAKLTGPLGLLLDRDFQIYTRS